MTVYVVRSRPAVKARSPSAVITIQRISGFALRFWIVVWNSLNISMLKAFNLSGRFSETSAIDGAGWVSRIFDIYVTSIDKFIFGI